jgi:hypothetical protein
MKKLYLSWQDPKDRRWLTVGRLTYHDKFYRFVYTKGAEISKNFSPFGRMKSLKDIYESSELFPLFANRLLSKSRPDFKRFMRWLNLQETETNPFLIFALTGGLRKTDSLELFPCPEPTPGGYYLVKFFNRGLSHLPEETWNRVNKLKPGDRLYIMADLQNPKDEKALALRTDDPASIVGYCPRYFTSDFNWFLKERGPNSVKITVIQNNLDAPFQLRLLCKLTAKWAPEFKACSNELFKPIPENISDDEHCDTDY